MDYFDLRITANTNAVPVGPDPRLVYLLVEMLPTAQAPLHRAPVNLVLIVDASESMLIPAVDDDLVAELQRRGLLVETISDGVPVYRVLKMPPDLMARAQPVCSMDFVQAALREVIGRLGDDDRLSLVAFAERAQTLVANCPGKRRQRLLEVLDPLSSGQFGDETLVATGLALGLREAVSGHAPERMTRLVLLTDGFAADEEDAAHVATQAAQQGFGVSTVGLGTAFNEGFLIALAEDSGGNAHLVFEPADIPDVFAAEFEATQRVLVRAVSLRLALTQGVEVRRIYRVQPLLGELTPDLLQDRSLTVTLGDMEREQPMAVLLELIVPPRAAGMYRLAQVVATGEAPQTGGERTLVRGDVVVQVTAGKLDQPDARVMKLVEAVSTFKLQTQALAEAAAGNMAGATRKLQAVATRLLADGEADMAEVVQAELDNLAQRGALSPAGAKTLRYETRKLTQKLDDLG